MPTKKAVVKTVDTFSLIQQEAARLGIETNVYEFLKKKGFKLNKQNMTKAYDFLKTLKKLEDFSLDELVQWRLAVRNRLFENEKAVKEAHAQINKLIKAYLKQMDKLFRKRNSDFEWYNKVSAIIGRKTGMHSNEKISLEIDFKNDSQC